MRKKLSWQWFLSTLVIMLTISSMIYQQTPSVSANSLQDSTSNSSSNGHKKKRFKRKNDLMVRYIAEDGTVGCRTATEEEITLFSGRKTKSEEMHQLNHFELSADRPGIQPNATGLKIMLRGTRQLDNFPDAKAAFIKGAATWEALIQSPITLVVDVDFGPTRFGTTYPNGVIGSTDPQEIGDTNNYADVRNALITTASNPQDTAIYNSLPKDAVPTDLGSTQGMFFPSSLFRAIGMLQANADPTGEQKDLGDPPSIGFSSAFNYDFDPSNGIDAGKLDFDGTVVHELGHLLGFTSNTGFKELAPSFPNVVSIWDLFRFRPDVTSQSFSITPRIQSSGGTQVYFTGSGSQLQLATGRPNGAGGDGSQSSHWKAKELNGNVRIGIMDPFLRNGERAVITSNDMATINLFGYKLASESQANITVKVNSPNGKEVFATGGDLPVSWTVSSNNSLASQNIDLSTDSGASFPIPVATGLSGDTRSFTFKLPATILSDTVRVRVTAKDSTGATGSDASDGDFSIAVPKPDFSVSVSPSSQMVSAGSSTSFNVAVQGLNGFNQQVSLASSFSPQNSGISASFSNTSVAPGSTSTLTVNTSSSISSGTFNLVITATSGQVAKTTTVTVNVVATQSFMLNVSPAMQSVLAGSSGQFAVSFQPLAGFNQPVTLTASSDQAKITGLTFSQSTISIGQTANLMVPVPLDSPSLVANITVTATAGQIVKTATIKLEVLSMDFSLSFPQQPITLKRGSTGQFVVKIDRTNGFAGNVTITPDATTLSNLKVKLKSAASQSTTGTTVMFDFKLKAKAPTGTQKLVFTGVDNLGRTKQAELMIVIN